MEYSPDTGYDAISLLEGEIATPGVNFLNPDRVDDIIDANEILFAVYDATNQTMAELIFRGTHDLWSWFAADNLISSYPWKLDVSDRFETFELNIKQQGFSFQMTVHDDSPVCDSLGYLNVFCQDPPLNCVGMSNQKLVFFLQIHILLNIVKLQSSKKFRTSEITFFHFFFMKS